MDKADKHAGYWIMAQINVDQINGRVRKVGQSQYWGRETIQDNVDVVPDALYFFVDRDTGETTGHFRAEIVMRTDLVAV